MKISHKKVIEAHNRLADKYDAVYEGPYNEYETELELEILLEYIGKNKKIKILDAAGGTGRLAILLAKKGYNLCCLDLAENMLKIGEEKAIKEKVKDKIGFVKGDMTRLEFEDNSFEVSFCFGTGLSYCDAEKALRELRRVTKKNGLIIVDFKNIYRNIGKLIEKNKIKEADNLLNTRKLMSMHGFEEVDYTIEDIEKLVKKSGLKLVKLIGKNPLYQYLSKIEDVDELVTDKKTKESLLKIDRKLRYDEYFIPLSEEIVAVIE